MQKKNFNGKGQVVLFKLGMEKYSLDLFNVLHIIKLDKLAKIEPIQLPQFPFYVEMIVQLQGRFIPVIDLRKKLTLSQQDYLDENRIIVLKVKNINLGIAVDATHSIISISNSYERGIIRELDNYLISLLNIKRYTSTDKEEIHSLAT